MKRRDFSAHLTGLAGAAALIPAGLLPHAALAQSQGAPVAGKDFVVLKHPPLPTSGKIVVTEFFWYGCPHCYALEPLLEPWIAKLPPDVQFRLVPYDFGEALREVHKRVFCTWEVLGLVGAMHARTFDRFHRQRKPINTEADMLAFAEDSGLDVAKVKAAWNSFGTQVKMNQATDTCERFDIRSTPVLAVQDRFKTEPAMTGSGPRTLEVLDTLVSQVQRGR